MVLQKNVTNLTGKENDEQGIVVKSGNRNTLSDSFNEHYQRKTKAIFWKEKLTSPNDDL